MPVDMINLRALLQWAVSWEKNKAHLNGIFILPLNSIKDLFCRQTNACHYCMLKGNIESDLEQAGTEFFLLI